MNQTRRNPDRLHHAPDNSAAALLLIDVINDLEFEGGEALLPSALKMAAALAALKRRAKEQGIPVIYANDNFGAPISRNWLNIVREKMRAAGKS
jgi:nicotinamidase-related amidase